MKRASKNCLELIKKSEGLYLKPYKCPAGVPTIGYGSTLYPDGRKVSLTDRPITLEEAESILAATLTSYENAVNRYVQVPINQNQFDALVDFAYNLGNGALQTSTLLRKLNAGDYAGASAEIPKWNRGGGRVLPGLVTRCAARKALFDSPV